MKPELEVSYDADTDVLTVEGVNYSGAFFRAAAIARPGTWLKFERTNVGGEDLVTVHSVQTVPVIHPAI